MKLYAGVKPRWARGPVNPLNPNDWTLYELRKYPYSLWLVYIEPKLIIFGNEDADCWIWGGKNRQTSEGVSPQVWAAWNYKDEHPVFKVWTVRRLVAKIFYDFPDKYEVQQNKDICNNPMCVRPSHFIIGPKNAARSSD